MSIEIPIHLDAEHRRALLGGEPMIFHCHHYNTFLQQSIQDAVWLDSEPFLVGAAAEVAHAQLQTLFKETGADDVTARKALASEVYRTMGFGTFDLAPLSESGAKLSTPNSHYAMAWRAKFGEASEPVCHFARGWLAGATAAIYGRDAGSYRVTHGTCRASASVDTCVFEVQPGEPNYDVFSPVGVGGLTEHVPVGIPETPVDYEGIFSALTGMAIVGDADGNIPAFGVYLTRHFANYYNRISFEFLRRAVDKLGPSAREVAEPLLIEAGHVCAFNTFGGIMTSPEWDGLIKPSLKTREDWVHGIVAAANALGWGRWQVSEVSEDRAKFVLHDDYESVGYEAMYGAVDHSVSYLAQGGVMGIMDLVYLGDIASRPALTPAFYERLFKSPDSYRGSALGHRCVDGTTSFEVVQAEASKRAA